MSNVEEDMPPLTGDFCAQQLHRDFTSFFLFSCVSGEKFESFDFPGDFKV
jgi:hypothetical protein